MPTPAKGPRLGGGPAHERLILANLATALFEHDSITTTEAKAKRLRPLAERMITFAKRGDLHARRRVMTVVRDKGVVHRLFVEIAPDMAERPGGYTRITKISARKGDNAPMAIIELVREPLTAKPKRATVAEAEGATKRAAKERRAKEEAAAPAAGATAADAAPVDDQADVAVEEETPATTPIADSGMAAAAPVADAPAADDDVTDTPAADEDAGDDIADLTDAEPVAATEPAALAAPTDPDPAATQAGGDTTAESDEAPADAGEQPAAVDLPAGAVAPNADGSAPAGYTVKGNADSGLYHVEGSQWFDNTEAEFWFTDAAAAEAAGFKPAGGAAKQNVDESAPVPFVEAEYGAGSAEPHADGSQPVGFDIKGNKDSMLYHVPGSQWYDATEAEVWFDSTDAAEKAGFQPAGGAEKQQVDDEA